MKSQISRLFLVLSLLCGLSFIMMLFPSKDSGSADSSSKYKFEMVKLNSFEEQARAATVRILLETNVHGTGTLFNYKGKTVVFTAAHVADFGKNYPYLVQNIYGENKTAKLIYIDKELDFAVLSINDFEGITPIPFKVRSFNLKNLTDLEVFFSSYPAQHDVLTSRGRVAGFEGEFILLNSVAWKGSSGASIFSRSGEFIGILFAISVDKPFGIPALIDNIIWVSPYDHINWADLDEAIEKIEDKKRKKK